MLVGGGPYLCSIPLYAVLSGCWCHGNQRADTIAWAHDAGGLNEGRCRTGSGIDKWWHVHPQKHWDTLHIIISQRTSYVKVSVGDSLPCHHIDMFQGERLKGRHDASWEDQHSSRVYSYWSSSGWGQLLVDMHLTGWSFGWNFLAWKSCLILGGLKWGIIGLDRDPIGSGKMMVLWCGCLSITISRICA